MIRRISTKLLLAVLAAVVLPFLGFAIFVDLEMANFLARKVVGFSLQGLAADLAGQVDRDIREHKADVILAASSPFADWAIRELDASHRGGAERETFGRQLDLTVREKGAFDLLLLLDYRGKYVTSSRVDHRGVPLDEPLLAQLVARDVSGEGWFQGALLGEPQMVDWHRSDLLAPVDPAQPPRPEQFHIGFAQPVLSEQESEQVIGVLYGLVNWSTIQDEVNAPVLKEYFKGLVPPGESPSAYAWIWGADADTIIAHDDPSLYGESVSHSARVGLPQMVAAARAAVAGMYPEYTFRGRRKSAAFKHTATPAEGGFGWVVGVGIDNDDIFTVVDELRALLFRATLVVLLISVLLTMVIARRTTSPILALQQATRRVAAGDLEAHIEVRSRDELGELAHAFNRMTRELSESRARLVKVEKDAAWREMARQVAHDIKNPLTPIQLSVDLVRRARHERSERFDELFEATLDQISRQVQHLREIASDFQALTGVSDAKPELFDAGELLDDVLAMDAAWARELGVEVRRTGAGGMVCVDPRLLRRALNNLTSNALQAMPEGGTLLAHVEAADARVRIELTDSGPGIPDEVRAHLFEPYFTTRSSGTGLGLAIARRVVEEMGGKIALEPGPAGAGTLASVELPRAPAS